MDRVYCLFGLCLGCGTPTTYCGHATGTRRPVEKKKNMTGFSGQLICITRVLNLTLCSIHASQYSITQRKFMGIILNNTPLKIARLFTEHYSSSNGVALCFRNFWHIIVTCLWYVYNESFAIPYL